MGVLQRPLNGVGDGPRSLRFCMDEIEAGLGCGEHVLGKDERPGDCCGGLKKLAAVGHGCFQEMAQREDAVFLMLVRHHTGF